MEYSKPKLIVFSESGSDTAFGLCLGGSSPTFLYCESGSNADNCYVGYGGASPDCRTGFSPQDDCALGQSPSFICGPFGTGP